jgi:hypothetical protein
VHGGERFRSQKVIDGRGQAAVSAVDVSGSVVAEDRAAAVGLAEIAALAGMRFEAQMTDYPFGVQISSRLYVDRFQG